MNSDQQPHEQSGTNTGRSRRRGRGRRRSRKGQGQIPAEAAQPADGGGVAIMEQPAPAEAFRAAAERELPPPSLTDENGSSDRPTTPASQHGSSVAPGTPSTQNGNGGERRRRRRGRGGGRSRNRRREHGEGTAPERAGVPVTSPTVGHAVEDAERTPVNDLDDEEEAPPSKTGDRLMLINVAEGEESRIAIVHQRRLEELFIERASSGSHVGNIYKGIVTNVEPSIQAAFIDFGLPKNGFLHISDLQPQYFPDGRGQPEQVGRKTPRRDRPPIQKCLRRGQEVIVQVIKEGIGTKGPTLTTYISIPGRYLVMMPGMNRLGVSRKIEDEEARRKMRAVLDELDLPKNMGFILRTAGMDKTKRDLQRDQLYLQRLWKMVVQRVKNNRAPCELYQESDLVIRTIRDVYSSEFSKIIVDSEQAAEKVRDFLSIAMPRHAAPVEVYKGKAPLFHRHGIEDEIDRIHDRFVPLNSGGSLIIESFEALVAIDVNSGRFRDFDDAEESAYRINLEAADEIARQLRLRDLGGLILCDFIDMRLDKHRRAVERALRDALKKHKERAKCLRMSQFGIIEMTRQRMRPSIKRNVYRDCPQCRGGGLVKTPESMSLDIMRLLRLAAHHDQVVRLELRTWPEVALELQNRRRAFLHDLEQSTSCRISIIPDPRIGPDLYRFDCYDSRGGLIPVVKPREPHRSPAEERQRRHEAMNRDKQPPEDDSSMDEVFD